MMACLQFYVLPVCHVQVPVLPTVCMEDLPLAHADLFLPKRLAIHLEDEQTIYYRDDEQTELANLLDRAAGERTMLLAWFQYNADHPEGSHLQLLYHQFPTHFTWQVNQKKWQPRRRSSDSIGRMYMTSPSRSFLELCVFVDDAAVTYCLHFAHVV